MKALSPLLYSKRNKKKVFASINSVMIAVCFLYILYAFSQSLLLAERRNSIPRFNKAAEVANYGGKPIDSKLLNEIKENTNVERLVPTRFDYSLRFTLPGSQDRTRALPIKATDMNYFMQKQDINLTQGRLPRDGLKEIAINRSVSINRNVKIGDKVGDSINKFDTLPGEYKIVGILDSDAFVSIVSSMDNDCTFNNFYAFSKDDKISLFNKYMNSLPKDKLNVTTKDSAIKHFESNMGTLKVMDVIALLSIIVMVVTVGSSKYAQYYNRKEEFGVLNAIGYNKNYILLKAFKEVAFTNSIGFILGTVLGLVFSFLLMKGLWAPSGVDGSLYTAKGSIVSLFIPLFTVLFSIVPINNLINKLDPIKMIEKN